MRNKLRSRAWKTIIALLLLLSTTVGSAATQTCASACLIFYGRFTVRDGEFYWYSSCTTTVIGTDTHYHCYYKAGSQF